MRLKRILPAILIIALGSATFAAEVRLFPNMNGWEKDTQPTVYSPDNLFEYINGAAEVFLGYDFHELLSTTYRSQGDQSITADVYIHADPRNGFGIYSQEKPTEGEFLKLGTEGYYETGILNFFQGRYYIKISAFDLGEEDRSILQKLARGIAANIPDKAVLPTVLDAFPSAGRTPHSRRFVRRNFLGHSFLSNAYTSEYRWGEEIVKPFIIEADTAEAAKELVATYLEFARGKGQEPEDLKNGARFTDPYYRSRGPLILNWRGRYIWGVFSLNTKSAEKLVSSMGQALP